MIPDLCSYFRRNPDGSWTCIKALDVTVSGAHITANPGMTLVGSGGIDIGGVDLLKELNLRCQ